METQKEQLQRLVNEGVKKLSEKDFRMHKHDAFLLDYKDKNLFVENLETIYQFLLTSMYAKDDLERKKLLRVLSLQYKIPVPDELIIRSH